MTDAPARRLDHVALAVRSIEEAARLFRDLMGATFVSGGDDEHLELRSAQYMLAPGTKIELLQPLTRDSGLARFIERHGEGFHHITMFFDDIERLIPEAEAAGFEVTDTDLDHEGWRETYLRPRSGFGALFQFVDTTRDWSQPVPGITEEAVLAGEVRWDGSRPVLKERG